MGHPGKPPVGMGSPEPPGSHLWAQRQWGHSSRVRKQTEKAGGKRTVQLRPRLQAARGHPVWKSVAGRSWLLESKILRISIPKGPLKSPTSLTAQLALSGGARGLQEFVQSHTAQGAGPRPRALFFQAGAAAGRSQAVDRWAGGICETRDGVAASRRDATGHNCASSIVKEQNAWLIAEALSGEGTFLNC